MKQTEHHTNPKLITDIRTVIEFLTENYIGERDGRIEHSPKNYFILFVYLNKSQYPDIEINIPARAIILNTQEPVCFQYAQELMKSYDKTLGLNTLPEAFRVDTSRIYPQKDFCFSQEDA